MKKGLATLTRFAKYFTAGLIVLTIAAAKASPQTLVAESTIPTPDVGIATLMPVHCDSSGDVLLRRVESLDLSGTLIKISASGKPSTQFDISKAAHGDLKGLAVKSFAVDRDDAVYQLGKTKDQQVVILKFDRGGQYRGPIVVNRQFEPQQLGVFEGGAFLISGVVVTQAKTGPEYKPYSAVFDSSGRLVREIETNEGNFAPHEPANRGHSDGNNDANDASDNQSFPPELGTMESAGSYVYLLRQGTKPTIYVLSPAGVVDRKVSLSPVPYPNAQVSALRVGAGQILLEFARPKAFPNGNTAYVMVLYDSVQGEKISEYTRGPDVTGTLGCTDWKGNFTFLSADDKGPVLIKARAR